MNILSKELISLYFIDESDIYTYMIFFLSIEDFEIHSIENIYDLK